MVLSQMFDTIRGFQQLCHRTTPFLHITVCPTFSLSPTFDLIYIISKTYQVKVWLTKSTLWQTRQREILYAVKHGHACLVSISELWLTIAKKKKTLWMPNALTSVAQTLPCLTLCLSLLVLNNGIILWRDAYVHFYNCLPTYPI